MTSLISSYFDYIPNEIVCQIIYDLSTVDILDFCSSGIPRMSLHDDEKFWREKARRATDPKKDLLEAIDKGEFCYVRGLVDSGTIAPERWSNYPIIKAAEKGHLRIVKFLASQPAVNPGARDNAALVDASQWGHLDVVKFLISLNSDEAEIVDPHAGNSKPLRMAVYMGRVDVVNFLIGLSPPAQDLHEILRGAIQRCNLEMVKILCSLKKVNPGYDELGVARRTLDTKTVSYLYSLPTVNIVTKRIVMNGRAYYTHFSHLTVAELKKFIVAKNIPMPRHGTGSQGRYLKYDYHQAICAKEEHLRNT